MTASDPILDDLFHWAAWEAFIAEARAVQGWPDPERTRERAYRLYEEELAKKNAGAAWRAFESAAVDGDAPSAHNSR